MYLSSEYYLVEETTVPTLLGDSLGRGRANWEFLSDCLLLVEDLKIKGEQCTVYLV